jgi:hypothetical protein
MKNMHSCALRGVVIGSEKSCGTYFHNNIVRGNKRQVNDYFRGVQIIGFWMAGCKFNRKCVQWNQEKECLWGTLLS